MLGLQVPAFDRGLGRCQKTSARSSFRRSGGESLSQGLLSGEGFANQCFSDNRAAKLESGSYGHRCPQLLRVDRVLARRRSYDSESNATYRKENMKLLTRCFNVGYVLANLQCDPITTDRQRF